MNYDLPPLTPAYVYYNPASEYNYNSFIPQYQPYSAPPPAAPEPVQPPAPVQPVQPVQAVQAPPVNAPPVQTTPPQQSAIVIPPPITEPQPVAEKPVEKPVTPVVEKPKEPEKLPTPIPEPVKDVSPAPQQTPASTPVKVQRKPKTIDPCCTLTMSSVCFGLVGIAAFVITVTITSVYVFGSDGFCGGFWINQPQYQLSGLPTVAVWAYIMATTILFIGIFLILENLAATYKFVGIRDQLRTIILLTSLFGFTWWITGNNWVIGGMAESYDGIVSMRGMIPDNCKYGSMGDRSFYLFLLAFVIILDVLVPVTAAYILLRTGLNRTFAG